MPELLSPEERAEFLAAVQDTTDTFFKTPITFRVRRQRKLTAFNDSRKQATSETDIEVLGLYVPGQDEVSAQAGGTADLSRGYVLCNRTDLAAVGLADEAGNLLFNPAQDTVVINNEEHQVEAAIPTGPLQGVFTLGKFLTKKKLRAST